MTIFNRIKIAFYLLLQYHGQYLGQSKGLYMGPNNLCCVALHFLLFFSVPCHFFYELYLVTSFFINILHIYLYCNYIVQDPHVDLRFL